MRYTRVLILGALVGFVALLAPIGAQRNAEAAPAKLSVQQLNQTTDRYLFDTSQGKFRKLRKEKPYNGQLNWTTDTCSWSPDQPQGYDFRTACQRHDFGYRNYKKQDRLAESSRKRIDDNFQKDMYQVCRQYKGWKSYKGVECRRIADGYYAWVRHNGR